MINNKEKIKKIAENFRVNTIYLFGSQARGDTHAGSDFDFAVQFKKNVSEDKFFDLKLELISEFAKLVSNDRVDVVVLNSSKTPLSLKFRAIKEGQILYVEDEILRSRMETDIMSYYFDRQYYSRRYVKESLAAIAER